MPIRMIAADLDGTLLCEQNTISPATLRAISAAARLGVRIVPATGRIFSELSQVLCQLPEAEYLVTANGAAVMTREREVLWGNCISPQLLGRVMSVVQNRHTFAEVTMEDGRSYSEREEMQRMSDFGVRDDFFESIFACVEPVDGLSDFLRRLNQPAAKIYLSFSSQEQRRLAWRELEALGGLYVTTSMENNLELAAAGSGKAQGLRALCEILKIDPCEVLALGDNHNDAGMLRLAGIGVAMGNATKEALQAADYVTAACDKDGAAGAIERFVLNACAGKDDLVGVAGLSREGL
ncbi:Cof-type HAD-IIB family hydrolase [Harryflintia acetispora]|uniref:Cof-type HAD-IIB family hydrolase n=1 Tax=Harryflintia acetispora TaxID=1849041 RepID=UPI00189B6A51|nr:HAD family hydrolase [Harryflintia acetispora]